MANETGGVKQNYVAIVVAAVVSSILQAVWNSYLLKQWLAPNTSEQQNVQYAVLIVGFALIAGTVSRITQLTGALTAMRGLKVASLLWLGVVFPVLTIKQATEGLPLSSWGAIVGSWLVTMLATGAIVGALNRKTK